MAASSYCIEPTTPLPSPADIVLCFRERAPVLDRLPERFQIQNCIVRIFLWRPRREFFRRRWIKGPGLHFQHDSTFSQGDDSMPDTRSELYAHAVCSLAIKSLRAELENRGDFPVIIERNKRKQTANRDQCFRLGVERMPMRTNITFYANRIQKPLTRVIKALVNIQVLPGPGRPLSRRYERLQRILREYFYVHVLFAMQR